MSEYKPITSNLAVFSTVGDTTSNTTILASNRQRKGATIVNTSTAILYLRFDGGTATATTGHNVQLAQNDYFEVPFGYTGAITGIWASDAGGAANVAEFT